MWSCAQSLRTVVVDVFCNGRNNRITELEEKLQINKSLFLSPLKCLGKDADHRLAVQKAVTESIFVSEIGQNVALTQDFVDEVLFLSDLFSTDELIILELLLCAVGQLPLYPDLSRGLLAVLLYYEAHLEIIDSLRVLIQARGSLFQSQSDATNALQLAAKFTDELWSSGLLKAILGSLRNFHPMTEFVRLENSRALGKSKHRYDVYRRLQLIYNGLCEIILLWSCHSPLSSDEWKTVSDQLFFSFSPSSCSTNEAISIQLTSLWDHGRVNLLMSLLYSLEPFALSSDVANTVDDLTPHDLAHPLLADPNFAVAIRKLLDSRRDSLDSLVDEDVSDRLLLLACLRLAWAVSLRCSAHIRSELSQIGQSSRSPTGSPPPMDCHHDLNAFGVDEELQVASSIDSGALEFVRKRLLSVHGFEREPLWVSRIHGLITDLLIYMPGRVKEIRLKDEDLLRRTGTDPSGFANLLLLLADLYDCPGSRLHARLALEYWWPSNDHSAALHPRDTGCQLSPSALCTRMGESGNFRQSSLLRFVRLAGDLTTSSNLVIPYLRMLHALVNSRSSATLCFAFLKSNASNQGRVTSVLSWDHFFSSFRQYLNHMRQPIPQAQTTSQSSLYPHLYGTHVGKIDSVSSLTSSSAIAATSVNTIRAIQPDEQEGLRVVLRLIARVARMDPVARSEFASNTVWQAIPTCTGLLTCPFPLALKAELLHFLTALSRTPATAVIIWRLITAPEILPILHSPAVPNTVAMCGLHTEMDEVESRAEEYPVTRAFLSFVTVAVPHLSATSMGTVRLHELRDSNADDNQIHSSQVLVSVVSFIANSIFLKHTMRAYRDPNERWDIAASCLVLFDGLIDQFFHRLRAAATVVTSFLGDTSSNGGFVTHGNETRQNLLSSSHADWAPLLLSTLQDLYVSRSSASQLGTRSALLESLHNLRLPIGWPHTDPGFLLARSLLWDSSLYRMITGLLEVGLHRFLEFPLAGGPAPGMTRATAIGLRLLQRILASEEILMAFVRRAAVELPLPNHGTNSFRSVPLPDLPSMNALPTCLSRLLMSVNSRTGRADLLPMLLRYCSLGELPDHCAYSMDILAHVLNRIRPHSELLSVLTVDSTIRSQLMNTFSSLLKLPDCSALNDPTSSNLKPTSSSNEQILCFSDEWLFDVAEFEVERPQLTVLGLSADNLPHPATQSARIYADLPDQPPYWSFPSKDWELWSAWPTMRSSVLTPLTLGRTEDILPSSLLEKPDTFVSGNTVFGWIVSECRPPLVVRLLHLLLSALDHPSPNLSHWLLGFRIESSQALSHTALQDPGIGNQPRTCLHAILDLFDFGLRCGSTIGSLPKEFALTIQWSLALAWQIIYRLASNPFTSEPLLRFLRSNYNLLAKHLQFGPSQPVVTPLVFSNSDDGALMEQATSYQQALELLSLNQANWLLRTVAIELRTAADGNQRSYASRLIHLLLGSLVTRGTDGEKHNDASVLLCSFLDRLQIADPLNAPEAFELAFLDSHVTEQLVSSCGFVCPLLASDSQAVRKVSTLIDPHLFFSRLYYSLISTRFSSVSSSLDDLVYIFNVVYHQASVSQPLDRSLTPVLKDLQHLNQFVNERNLYRLRLYAGKQAAFEAWRQLAEITAGLLVQHPASYLGSSSHRGDCGRERSAVAICLDLLQRLLTQLCKSEDSPSTIRLLSSGTLLHLTSYLGSPGIFTHCSPEHLRLLRNESATTLPRAVHMLCWLLLQTRSSAQRMRANFYGTISFMLRLVDILDHSASDSNVSLISECFSALMTPSKSCMHHWAQTEFLRGKTLRAELCAFHCLLAWDLLHGHAITQMAVMSLIGTLLSLDRSPRDLLTFVAQDFVLQHVVDSIPEDLAALESFLLTSGEVRDSDNPSIVNVTTAFHMYRAKMSLLCRLASTPTGAKALLQVDTVSLLSNCSIFSASTLSHSYSAAALDYSLAGRPLITPNVIADLATVFRSNSVLDNPMDTQSDEFVLRKIVHSSINESAQSSDNGVISWPGMLLPTVQLFGALLISLATTTSSTPYCDPLSIDSNTLNANLGSLALIYTSGPLHVAANQQVINFLYAHSDSLLLEETDLGNTLIQALSGVTANPNSPGIAEWTAAQTSLIELFALISRSQTSSANEDEYSTLQRDVVQSRILRLSLNLLSSLIPELRERRHPGTYHPQNFDYTINETQRIQLIRQLVAVCSASLSTPSILGSTTVSDKSRTPLFSLLRYLVQADANQKNTCLLTLLFSLASWSMDQLTLLEEHCVLLANAFSLESVQQFKDDSEAARDKKQSNSAVQLLLHYNRKLPRDHSVDELKQALSILFGCTVDRSGLSTSSPVGDPQLTETDGLQTLVSVGIALTRLRINALLDLCEQVVYISWRALDSQLSNPDLTQPQSVLQTRPSNIRPLHSAGSPVKLPSSTKLSSDNKKIDTALLKAQIQSLSDNAVLEKLDRLSKVTYLETSRQLFVRAMHTRLERIVAKSTQRQMQL